jgi:DNA-binding NarL/FixJ family response regulator
MRGNASEDRRIALAFSPTVDQTYRRILLFVSRPGSVSDAMAAAIEREFSWISVHQVPEPELACTHFDHDVQLILVDQSLIHTSWNQWQQLVSTHPGATAAVMTAPGFNDPEYLIHIITAHSIRGILPMDVNLDIWLSIIRIMLKGGEYFPPALFQRLQRIVSGDRVLADVHVRRIETCEQRSEVMDELTGREIEVLAMVARGYQNKIIAADLGLSEHTVKIHLHNIIKKLGVHNRTEAAAKYYEHANQREDDDAEPDLPSERAGPTSG